jgi:hypothetical protein
VKPLVLKTTGLRWVFEHKSDGLMPRSKRVTLPWILALLLLLTGCGHAYSGGPDQAVSASTALSGNAALTPDNPDPDFIRQKTIEAIGNIRTYRFGMTLDINLRDQNRQSINQHSDIQGMMDKPNQKLAINMSLNQQIENDASKKTTTSAEIYVDNDLLYVKDAAGNWKKQSAPDAIWDEQDVISQQMRLLESAGVKLSGTAKVQNQDCYRLEVAPDRAALEETLKQQLAGMPLSGGASLEDMLSNITLNIWVDRVSFLPLRVHEVINLKISPEDLGMQSADGTEAMTMQMDSDLTASDYNQPLKIEAPAGIDKASD